MRFKFLIPLLCYYCLLFSFSNQQMVNNPIKSNKVLNPVNYSIVYLSEDANIDKSDGTTITLKVMKNFTKFHDSYLINPSLYICDDEIGASNGHYVVIENRCYKISISEENEISSPQSVINMTSDVIYSNYIQAKEYNNILTMVNSSSPVWSNEVIIYGIKNQKIFFHYLRERLDFNVTIGDVDEQFSCKLVKEAMNICAFSKNGQVILKFFVYIYIKIASNNKVKGMEEKYSKDVNEFNNHENVILYDTSDSDYKILCAKRKDNNNIDCKAVSLNIEYSHSTSNFEINILEINNQYETSFSSNLDSCNFILYKSEYVICCGKINVIECDRRNLNFTSIDHFSIDLPGKISNLTMESIEDNLKLTYYNETNSEQSFYDYKIFT